MEREFRDARRQHDDLPAWLGGKDGAYHRGVSEGRATEREKVRALVEGLTAAFPLGSLRGEPVCRHCFGHMEHAKAFEFYLDHTDDCPWVEARLWLARDEVPE